MDCPWIFHGFSIDFPGIGESAISLLKNRLVDGHMDTNGARRLGFLEMIIFGPPEKIHNFIPSISTIVDFFLRFSTSKGILGGISGVNPPGYGSKLGTPKLWMVNTKLDIHICGPLGLPF